VAGWLFVVDQDLVFSALAEFAHTLVQRYAIGDVLSHLTQQVPRALDIAGAGVSVGDDDGVLRFVTCSSDFLVGVERTQEVAQQGPCVDAYHSGQVVTTDDLDADDRWPQYRPVALAGGFRAVAAIPLHAAEVGIGSLNLYATAARTWSDDTIRTASLFADMAAGYLANASDLQRSERMREQLQQALESRVIIEQAKGLIAGQQNATVDVAYERLRRYTRKHNARLHDVANAVVHLGLHIDT
jgi:GAF domain-containing protein